MEKTKIMFNLGEDCVYYDTDWFLYANVDSIWIELANEDNTSELMKSDWAKKQLDKDLQYLGCGSSSRGAYRVWHCLDKDYVEKAHMLSGYILDKEQYVRQNEFNQMCLRLDKQVS